MVRQPILTATETKALTSREAIGVKWDAKTEPTLKQERDGYVLALESRPESVTNEKGEAIGVRVQVRLFGPKGNEIKIDPDRVIVNPPQQIVISDAEYDKDGNETKARVLELNPEAAIWECIWQSVLTRPGVV